MKTNVLPTLLFLALLVSALAGCGGSLLTYEQESLDITGAAAFDGELAMEGTEVTVSEINEASGSIFLEHVGRACFKVRSARLCATTQGIFEFRVSELNQLQVRGCGSLFGVEPVCGEWTNVELDDEAASEVE